MVANSPNDHRHLSGPFDVIGDVHGCRAELETLLDQLGYAIDRDAIDRDAIGRDAIGRDVEGRDVDGRPIEGRPIDAAHPDGRTAVFVGDLVDRGPDTPGVLRLAMGMVTAGHALAVPGNHENKLVRALTGHNVQMAHGLAETMAQLAEEPAAFATEVVAFCRGLPSHLVLDAGQLIIAHAGLPEAYHGTMSGRERSFALYGQTTGETDEFGFPVRYPWATDYRGAAMVLYGHTPIPEPEWINNTLCLDTGCVFGGTLTALRYPERQLVSVPARQAWYAWSTPFGTHGPQ